MDLFSEPLVVAGTGHRPSQNTWRGVGGWGDTWLHARVQGWLGQQLDELNPVKVISGMALGVDTWLALEALARSIPLVAAIPFEGQHSTWPRASQETYLSILGRAAEVVNVSGCRVLHEGGQQYLLLPSGERVSLLERSGEALVSELMQRRNVWMVDHASLVLAVWDGTPGGTKNCMGYVEHVGRQYKRLDPSTLRDSIPRAYNYYGKDQPVSIPPPPTPTGARRRIATPSPEAQPPQQSAPPVVEKTPEEVAQDLVPGVPAWESRGRWGSVIESVEQVDPAALYKELTSKLKLGEHATEYGTVHRALDDAEFNAFQAGKLARAAKLEEQRVERQCEQELEVLRTKARKELAKEGGKKPTIQEVDDYMMRAGTGWPELVARLKRRKEEAHAQRAVCEHLETSWRSRCNTLRIMGMKLKGIDTFPEGVT